MALSKVRWLAGSRPVSCPSPVAAPGPWSTRAAGAAGAAEAAAPHPARPSRAAAASAASAAIGPRLDARNGLEIL